MYQEGEDHINEKDLLKNCILKKILNTQIKLYLHRAYVVNPVDTHTNEK